MIAWSQLDAVEDSFVPWKKAPHTIVFVGIRNKAEFDEVTREIFERYDIEIEDYGLISTDWFGVTCKTPAQSVVLRLAYNGPTFGGS